MAFILPRAGDKYRLGHNCHLKVPKSGYTAKKGDLVILDTSLANGVDLIADNEAAYGIVESLNNGNGTLSVVELLPGTYIELPYTGSAPNLGDKVAGVATSGTHGSSLDRSLVDADNSNGTGSVVAVDGDTPHGTGHVVVRY